MEHLTVCLLCGSDALLVLDASANIKRCEACGYVFDDPRPTIEEISAYYSRPSKYDDWLGASQERESLWRRRLKKLLRHRVGGDLLDIGTGIGQFLKLAQPHFSSVTGTEVSSSAAQIARERYGQEVINDLLERIDFGGQKFDVITLFHVLEHVHDPLAVVRKCHSLLRNEGLLVIAVPNELQAFRQKVRIFMHRLGLLKRGACGKLGIAPIVLDGSLTEIHLSHFTPTVLGSLVQQNGFKICENGLDPYYVAKGGANMFHTFYYGLMSLVRLVSGANFYDTIWLVARKQLDTHIKGGAE